MRRKLHGDGGVAAFVQAKVQEAEAAEQRKKQMKELEAANVEAADQRENQGTKKPKQQCWPHHMAGWERQVVPRKTQRHHCDQRCRCVLRGRLKEAVAVLDGIMTAHDLKPADIQQYITCRMQIWVRKGDILYFGDRWRKEHRFL